MHSDVVPEFTWDTVSGASSYNFQVSVRSDFGSTVASYSGGNNYYTPPSGALARGVLYYFRVQSVTGSTPSAWATHSMRIRVRPVEYAIRIWDTGNLRDFQNNVGTTVEYVLPQVLALESQRSWNWEVTARDAAGNERPAATWQFPLADAYPPTSPDVVFPKDGDTILTQKPAFDWTDASDPSGVVYTFQLALDSGFSNLVLNLPGGTQSNYALTQSNALTRGTTYYWRLLVADTLGNSRTSPTYRFTVDAKQSQYVLRVAKNSSVSPVDEFERFLGPNVTEYTPQPFEELDVSQPYYWQVVASDPAGNERFSSIYNLSLSDNFPPSLPDLEYPAPGATVANPRVAFDWSDSTDVNAITYRLQVAVDSGFTNLAVDQSTTNSFSTLPSNIALTRGQTYFWRVVVTDSVGNSSNTPYTTLTIDGKKPKYRLEVSESSNFNVSAIDRDGLILGEYVTNTYEELFPGRQYYWRVTAEDDSGNARTSSVFTFQMADVFPPSVSEAVYPAASCLGLPCVILNPQVSYAWTPGQDVNGVTYRLQVASDSGFNTILIDQDNLTSPQFATQPSQALSRATGTYYWRVLSRDTQGNVRTGDTWSFKIDDKAARYNLEVATDSLMTSVIVDQDNLDLAEFQFRADQALTEGRNYYWRVTARDTSGNERQSAAIWQLSIADAFPPSLPEPEYPEYDPADIVTILNPLVAFDWSDSQDPNGVTYRLQVATDGVFGNIVIDQSGLTSSQYQPTAGQSLERGRTYFWRVLVSDSLGNSQASSNWSFFIDAKGVLYNLRIARDSSFTQVHAEADDIINTELPLDAAAQLTEGRSYFWKIEAVDSAGNIRPNVSDFVLTLADTYAPESPLALYPPAGEEVLNLNPDFDWTDSADPNGVLYEFQLSYDQQFSSLVHAQSSLTSSEISLPSSVVLERGRLYFWRVNTSDTLGNRQIGSSWEVRVAEKKSLYKLEVADNAQLLTPQIEVEDIQTQEYIPGLVEQLTDGRTYYWQVTASDPALNERVSAGTFSFPLADNFAPSAPVALYPLQDEEMANDRVVFDWTDSSDQNGVNYHLEVSESTLFSTTIISQTGLTSSHYTPSATQQLTRGRTYYWRVNVSDNQGNSALGTTWSFNVKSRDPIYSVEIAEDSGFATIHASADGIEVEEFLLSSTFAITEGRDYFWRVSATDHATNVTVSPVFQFNAVDNYPPSFPDPVYPAVGASVLNTRSSFDWSESADPNGVAYRIQISTDSGFSNLVIDEATSGNSNYTLTAAQALARGQSYFWRIVVSDSLNNSAPGPAWQFDVASKDVEYKFEIAEDANFSVVTVTQENIVYSSFDLDQIRQLQEGVTYHWRVTAEDKAENTRISSQSFVMSIDDIYPPTLAIREYPVDDSPLANDSVVFDWSDSVDSNGVSYEFQLATDTGFVNVIASGTNLTASNYGPVTVPRGTRHYWRVNVADSRGNAANGDVWPVVVTDRTIEYDFAVAEDNSFTIVHHTEAGLAAPEEYILPSLYELDDGRPYYWRIGATDLAGNRIESNVAFRLQLQDIFPPTLPEPVFPAHVLRGTSWEAEDLANPQATFDWTDAVDNNGVAYTIQIATDSSFINKVVDQRVTNSNYTLTAGQTLARGGRYYWRIGVEDSLSNSQMGPTYPIDVASKGVSYRIEVADNSGFSQASIDQSNVAYAEYLTENFQQLTDGVGYWWRVTASDSAGNNQVSSSTFQFDLADIYPPTMPEAVYPGDGAIVANTQVFLDWTDSNDSSGTVNYDVEVALDSSFSFPVFTQRGLTVSEIAAPASSALTRGTEYFWRVTVSDGSNSQVSPIWSMTAKEKTIDYTLTISENGAFNPNVLQNTGIENEEYALASYEELQDSRTYYWKIAAEDEAGNIRDVSSSFRFDLADTYPPSTPDLEYPADAAEILNPQIAFDWSDSSDSNGVIYGLEVASDSNFSNVLVSRSNLTDSHVQLTAAEQLVRGNLYYWRVTTRDNAQPTPNTGVSATQSFTVVDRAVDYRIEVSEDSSFTVITFEHDGVPNEEYVTQSFEELSEGQTYYWRVRSFDMAENERLSSSVFQFQLDDIYPPTAPVRVFPVGDEVANPRLTFDWSDSVDSNGVVYDLEVATGALFGLRVVNRRGLTNSHHTLTATETLNRDQVYFWRVTARDTRGNAITTGAWRLKVNSHDVRYRLQISEANSFATIAVDQSDITTEEFELLQVQALSSNVQYYWRVAAGDSAGNERISGTFQFQLQDVYAPSGAIAVYPPPAAKLANPRADFDWTDAFDETSFTYTLQVSTTEDFATYHINASGLSDSHFVMTGTNTLARGQQYFWRVRMIDSQNNLGYTDTWPFSVDEKDVRYELDVSKTQSFASLDISEVNIEQEEFVVDPVFALDDNNTYYWQVRGIDTAGNTRSAVASFSFDLADNYPPSFPDLLYPTRGSTMANPTLALDWSDSTDSNGVTYSVEVATDAAFTQLVGGASAQGLTQSSYTLPSGVRLTRGDTYYWRVSVLDSLGNGAVGQPSTFNVTSKVARYQLEIAEDSSFTTMHLSRELNGVVAGNLEYELETFEEVADGQDYYWRVTGEDFSGNAVTSAVFTFRLADIFPPTMPDLLYPAHTATVANPVAVLDWSDATDPAGVVYELEVSSSPQFASGSSAVSQTSLTNSNFTLSSALTRGTTYHWRVRTKDTLNNIGPWSTANKFTVEPKDVRYDLSVGLDSAFTNLHFEAIGLDTVEYPTPVYQAVSDGPTYFWKVRAVDVAGNELIAGTNTFALQDMYAPPEPVLLYPVAGSTMANSLISFDWTDVSDSNGVSYAIDISDDASFSSIVATASGLSASAHTVSSSLDRSKQYFWRIRTTDGLGNTQAWPGQWFAIQPKVRSDLKVATDANMANVVYLQNGLAGSEHTTSATAAFDVGRDYWWTVDQMDGAGHVVSQTGTPFRFRIQIPTLATSNVTPRTQPERADYEFGMNRPVDWVLTLQLRESGQCTRNIHRTTLTAQANLVGTWVGLSPGAEYCWSVVGSDTTGMVQDSGTFSLPALGTFSTAPTYTRTGIEVDVAAAVPAAVAGPAADNGYAQYSPGTCASIDPTSLRFSGNQIILYPGDVIPRNEFSFETWIRLASANQTKDLLVGRGGNIRIGLNAGRVRALFNTDNGLASIETTSALPVGQYAHVVVSYGEHSTNYTGPRIYIDGVNRTAATPFAGNLLEGTLNVLVGGFGGNGFSGDLASIGFYSRAIPTTEAQAHAALGARAEIPQTNGRIAYYPFDENNHQSSVQSVYDATGNHYAGVLGTNHLGEAFDALRLPVFNQTVALSGRTSFAGRLTNMPGGPDYCGRVVANTSAGWISSSPLDDFIRNTDLEKPRVSVNLLNLVRECTGPNTPVTITVGQDPNPPSIFDVTITDDVSPYALMQKGARIGSRTGQAITSWPHSFSVGDHSLYWYATDEAGNTGWGDVVWWENNRNVGPQTLRVRDTTNPVGNGGPTIVVEASAPTGTPATPQLSSASDLCSPVTVTYAPQGPYALGDYRVEFTIEDQSGNTTTATRTLSVRDTQPPFFNPSIGAYTVASPGGCFQYTPVTPPVEDLGYDSAQIIVSGERVSGSGLGQSGNCWNGGRHIYRWTLRDPSGNQRVVDQLITIVGSTLDVAYAGLEVPGRTNPQPREFYNQNVTVVFTVSGGDNNYSLIVEPAPAALSGPNTQGEYRALYTAEGPYDNILIRAQDGGGAGANFGAALLDGFGIDRTAPVIDVDNPNCPGCAFTYLDQSAVNLAETYSYPSLYFGEGILLERIFASDGAVGLRNVQDGLRFSGGQFVKDPSNSAWPAVSPSHSGLSVAMWIRTETRQHATLFEIPDASRTVALTMTDRGRLCWGYGHASLQPNESIFDQRSCGRNFTRAADTRDGIIREREWHYIVATWDFNRGTWNIYVDGKAVGHRAGVGVRDANWTLGGGMGTRMIVGAHTNYGVSPRMGNYFVGELAQVHVSTRELTMDDIIPAYRGGVGADLQPSTSSWGLYKFAGNPNSTNGLQDLLDSSNGIYGVQNMILGATSSSEASDPARIVLADPFDSKPGGLRTLSVRVIETSMNRDQLVSVTSTVPSGTRLNRGRRWMGGIGCTVTGACTRGDSMLNVSALRFWNGGNVNGRFKLEITATDVAGNQAVRELGFKTADFEGALAFAIDATTRASQSPDGIGVTEIEDAIIDFQVARSYWQMSSSYPDGAYLRTARGMGYLDDAEQIGVDTGTISVNLARALQGQVSEYIDSSIGSQSVASDAALKDTADNYLRMAEFYKQHAEGDPSQEVALARSAHDSVALLYPRYQSSRNSLRVARGDWQSYLSQYNNGNITIDYLRDGPRKIRLRQMMQQTAEMLRFTMYREIEAVLSNPFTSQRQALEEMLDVLDKSASNDPNEEGDLLNITNAAVQDACLDVLAQTFDLPDDEFARCYIRINDLARFLDSVSEPLVHTYRFRAGLAQVLFNLLETSLYLSPTASAWAITNAPYTTPQSEQLVLPDLEAANVNGAIPLSTVDASDGAMTRAYARFNEARNLLDSGDVDSAWSIFVQERCLLLTSFNRYFSTDRMVPGVADPKEPPILPSSVGCP